MPTSPSSDAHWRHIMPLGPLQHYTIEPSNLTRTKKFYCEVLGLENGDRPPLGFPGYWLYSGDVATVHLLGPRKPREGIVVIDKAPRNGRGKVEYATDIFILRPKDFTRGNGRILYEVNNRGRKMLFGNIADGPQGVNDPKTAADVGNGFPLRRGYTLVWSGWDPDAPRANMGLALSAPVATDNGQPIVKTVRDEFCSGTRGGALEVFKLSYEANTLEP